MTEEDYKKDPYVFHLLDEVQIDAYLNATYDLEFKKLVPIIFSHGLAASNKTYTAHCRELAANGFLVIAFNAHDGSCSYTEKKDGTPV